MVRKFSSRDLALGEARAKQELGSRRKIRRAVAEPGLDPVGQRVCDSEFLEMSKSETFAANSGIRCEAYYYIWILVQVN
jgi:hypothetical protein